MQSMPKTCRKQFQVGDGLTKAISVNTEVHGLGCSTVSTPKVK